MNAERSHEPPAPSLVHEVTPSGGARVEVSAVATKDDLREAKDDLRREMKLWLGIGSAFGTAFAGLIGAFTSGGAVSPTDSLSAALGVLPF